MKNLKIKIEKRFDGFVSFKVIEQSHRDENFGESGDSFIASNGIVLRSVAYPSWGSVKTLFVRNLLYFDDDLIVVNEEEFNRIEAAIAEYNEFFKN